MNTPVCFTQTQRRSTCSELDSEGLISSMLRMGLFTQVCFTQACSELDSEGLIFSMLRMGLFTQVCFSQRRRGAEA